MSQGSNNNGQAALSLEDQMKEMAKMMAAFQAQLAQKDEEIKNLKSTKPATGEKKPIQATRKNGVITISFPEQKDLISSNNNPMLVSVKYYPTTAKDDNGQTIMVTATIMPEVPKKVKA